jgi:hypothetical protein
MVGRSNRKAVRVGGNGEKKKERTKQQASKHGQEESKSTRKDNDNPERYNPGIEIHPLTAGAYRLQEGIRPRRPMSTTVSVDVGVISKTPLPLSSFHSKLLLMDNDMVAVMSVVSFPVMVNGVANCPVTTHEP